jgi:glycolate dehydrogenase iron-sulfur subunit
MEEPTTSAAGPSTDKTASPSQHADAAGGRPTSAVYDPYGELAAAAADCVHCGFCLPACPTYQLWGEEMDSPRGRIHLISQVIEGAPVTDAVTTHLDRCLGCMACVPACPSGVRYNELIEAARTWTEEPPAGLRPAPARSLRERAVRAAIFATFPYPVRLRALTGPLRAAQRAGVDRRAANSNTLARLAPQLTSALRLAPRRAGFDQPAATRLLHSRPARPSRPAPGSGPAGPDQPRRPLGGRIPWPRRAARDERIAAQGQQLAVVGLLTGCVQRVFFPEVNTATARVLSAEGCEIVVPAGQGCCGALSLHSGRASEAARFARRTIETFERAGVDTVVVNSAGCGSAMKEYGALLERAGAGWAERAARFSGRVRDFSEFLAALYAAHGGPRAARHELAVTAVYHDACHLTHAQRISQQPRDLLRGIPGLELTEAADAGTCCGSAGVYNLLQPEAAQELGERKAASLRATGARLIVSANPGCSLQIASSLAANGQDAPAVAHIAEVLDASLRGLPVTHLGTHP